MLLNNFFENPTVYNKENRYNLPRTFEVHPKSWTQNFWSMKYSFKEKLAIVSEVICGKSKASVRRKYNVDQHVLEIWVARYRLYGEAGLLRAKMVRHYSPAEKERIILEHVQDGVSLSGLSVRYGLERSTIKAWLREVRSGGSLNGVKRRTSPPPEGAMARPKKKEPQTDLEKLQAENLRLRAEIALLKKVKALVEEQEAQALLNGQKPSTS